MSSSGLLSAAGRCSELLSLTALQSKMKCDPEGYNSELLLVYNQFTTSLALFQQQAAMSFTSLSGVAADASVAEDLGERALFLSQLTPFYPKQLSQFPKQLAEFLRSSARSLPSSLRCKVTQALALLINRNIVDIGENLALFMELQTLGDRVLRKLAFSHVICTIKKMNKKHKNEAKNRTLQNILFSILQQDDEVKAKRALTTLCDLHKRKVWDDERTSNAICRGCFHSSSRILIAALSFLLYYENRGDDGESDGSSSEELSTPHKDHVILNKVTVYKAHCQGTVSSKKKKKAKLQRVLRSMKKQQRLSLESQSPNYDSPLNHLKDAQGFAEKLFTRLQTCNERFEVRMMMLKVIARTIGLYRLVLLNFYPYIQKYVQPHQGDLTNLLAAAVQACHDMVPPDAVEPLFKQIVNQFVHDRSRPEAISVGLNVVREICLRIPLLMTDDLLQDLVLYKKSREKSVSSAAQALVILFRQICPSLLVKKDRGRPTNPKAKPRAFGEVSVADNVPGIELLQHDNEASHEGCDDGHMTDESMYSGSDDDESDFEDGSSATDSQDDETQKCNEVVNEEVVISSDDENDNSSEDEDNEQVNEEGSSDAFTDDRIEKSNSASRKRKFSEIDKQMKIADTSLLALRRSVKERTKHSALNSTDCILSDEDFLRIKKAEAERKSKMFMTQHGLLRKEIPSSDQLSLKRVDASTFEVNVKKKLSKEERLAVVREGRVDRGPFQARSKLKKQKTGGLSNAEKEHRKLMPRAAVRSKRARSRQEKQTKRRHSSKQFRGRKAWKS